jgi:uncharacterized protein (TIGR02271 family)
MPTRRKHHKAGRFLVTAEAKGREDEARAILQRFGGFDRAGWAAVRADRACAVEEGATRTEDGRTIQLKEEQLRAHKQAVKTGEVHVRKEVVTEHKQVNVPVEREEVVVERRSAGRRAASGDMKREEIRIPVKEEKVTVTKTPVVKEEVSVGKRKARGAHTVSGTVRREELAVEHEGQARARHRTRATSK